MVEVVRFQLGAAVPEKDIAISGTNRHTYCKWVSITCCEGRVVSKRFNKRERENSELPYCLLLELKEDLGHCHEV